MSNNDSQRLWKFVTVLLVAAAAFVVRGLWLMWAPLGYVGLGVAIAVVAFCVAASLNEQSKKQKKEKSNVSNFNRNTITKH